MKNLETISSEQFAGNLFRKINSNFNDVKAAIDNLEQNEGGSSGGGTTIATPKYHNNPFPIWEDQIRILCLGNSYTYTPLMYLGEIVNASGIDKSKFRLEIAYETGQSLEAWLTELKNNTTPSKYLMGGGTLDGTSTTSGGVRTMISSRNWDVVVLQQNSNNSGNYSTYEPYLTQIVNIIRENCPNQKVCIAWQQTWSKSSDYETNWKAINAAVKSMLTNNGINFIIPTGTAIQNGRNLTSVTNVGATLMWDSSGHLAYGVARYIGSCTWFQSLFAPIFNVSIIGNSATHDATNSNDYQNNTYYGGIDEAGSSYKKNCINVTNDNKLNCQQCALAAITDMWNITTIS